MKDFEIGSTICGSSRVIRTLEIKKWVTSKEAKEAFEKNQAAITC